MRYVGAAARADHDHPGAVLVRGLKDLPGDVPVACFADITFRLDPGVLQIFDDLGDQPLALAFRAIHLHRTEPAHRDLVDVQHNDLIAAVAAQLAGHLGGGRDMARRVHGQQDRPVHVVSSGIEHPSSRSSPGYAGQGRTCPVRGTSVRCPSRQAVQRKRARTPRASHSCLCPAWAGPPAAGLRCGRWRRPSAAAGHAAVAQEFADDGARSRSRTAARAVTPDPCAGPGVRRAGSGRPVHCDTARAGSPRCAC